MFESLLKKKAPLSDQERQLGASPVAHEQVPSRVDEPEAMVLAKPEKPRENPREVAERDLFTKELPESLRLDVTQISIRESSPSHKPFRDVAVKRYADLQQYPQNHIREFDVNNGVVVIVDSAGIPWVTETTPNLMTALQAAGYKKSELVVPFSNGEEPGGADAFDKWMKIKMNRARKEAEVMRAQGVPDREILDFISEAQASEKLARARLEDDKKKMGSYRG